VSLGGDSVSTIESSARRRPHRSLPHRATPATVSPRPKANLGTRTDTRNRVRTDPVDEAGLSRYAWSTVSEPPSTSRCWAASMSALPITPWRSGAGLS
jgi:hypothetical protein